MFLRATSLVIVVALGSACTGSDSTVNGPTPGNDPGPALEMTILGRVPCGAGVDAVACVDIKMINFGGTGSGDCSLLVDYSDENGGQAIEGPVVAVTNLPQGASIKRVLPWRKRLPAATYYFRGLCDPGLRS